MSNPGDSCPLGVGQLAAEEDLPHGLGLRSSAILIRDGRIMIRPDHVERVKDLHLDSVGAGFGGSTGKSERRLKPLVRRPALAPDNPRAVRSARLLTELDFHSSRLSDQPFQVVYDPLADVLHLAAEELFSVRRT